jgi:hypothetical protein
VESCVDSSGRLGGVCCTHGGGQQRAAVAVDRASASQWGEYTVDLPEQQHRLSGSEPATCKRSEIDAGVDTQENQPLTMINVPTQQSLSFMGVAAESSVGYAWSVRSVVWLWYPDHLALTTLSQLNNVVSLHT